MSYFDSIYWDSLALLENQYDLLHLEYRKEQRHLIPAKGTDVAGVLVSLGITWYHLRSHGQIVLAALKFHSAGNMTDRLGACATEQREVVSCKPE